MPPKRLWLLALAIGAMDASAACELQRYASLPVNISHGRAYISGSVNGVDALFFADSGAFFSMLTDDAARRFNLRRVALPAGLEVRGINGGADFTLTTVKEFSLTGFGTAHHVDFLVGGNAFGSGAAGIIGQNVIGHADTEYDLANGVIRLMHPKDCRNAMMAYWQKDNAVSVLPIQDVTPASPHVVAQLMLNGTRIGAMFDSGAVRSMLDKRAARRAGIQLDGPEVTNGGVWSGLNGRAFETWITRFDSLDLGGETIRNARLRIADVELPLGADMVLGMDFFLSHHIYVAASQRKIWFTYNGGRVFDLRPTEDAPQQTEAAAPAMPAGAAAAAAAAATPAPPGAVPLDDPTALRRRGAAFAERKEFGQAMADLNRAVELAPYDAENFHQRGLVCWQSGNVSQAASDFDQALKLKPDDVPTLVDRGALLLKGKAEASAQADFERAEQLAPKDAALSLRIAEIYEATARYREAATQLDRWVSDNPRDDRVAGVLGARCFARALTGDEPQLALSDCNTALRNGWRTSQVYESRGLLYLRARNFAKAMSDFNESLRLRANDPEALYGLGLAKNSAGQREAGERDMQAAVALRPGVQDEFRHFGLQTEH